MIKIEVSEEIKNACPCFRGMAVYGEVKNSSFNEQLWTQIEATIEQYKKEHTLGDIKKNQAIAATRNVYKHLGKDPNRYRPSSEALCRRIIRGLPLYQIDTLVDIINLVSIQTGYSIGGFDAQKIEGDVLTLGVGMPEEPYEAIGRGFLNIEGLPVYRDSVGGVGTPTSDNERTKIDHSTIRLLAIINGYSGMEGLSEAADYMKSLLEQFASAEKVGVFSF